MLFSARLFTLLACLSLVFGCGGDASLIPVEGKATADGQALTKGTVRFVPDTSKGNSAPHEPIGEIGSDGSYKLTTNGKPGAPAGWYKVGIASSEVPDSSKPNATKSYVASRFNDPQKSGISVEVAASSTPDKYEIKASAK